MEHLRAPSYLPLGLALLIVSGACFAGPITPDAWYEFGFDPVHSPLAAGCLPNDAGGVPCRTGVDTVALDARPWTFTTAAPVIFTITDGFLAADFFDVLDSGVLAGSTPSIP